MPIAFSVFHAPLPPKIAIHHIAKLPFFLMNSFFVPNPSNINTIALFLKYYMKKAYTQPVFIV